MIIVNQRSPAELSSAVEQHHDPRPGVWRGICSSHDALRVLGEVSQSALRIDRNLPRGRRFRRRHGLPSGPHGRRTAPPGGRWSRGPRCHRGTLSCRWSSSSPSSCNYSLSRGMRGRRVIWRVSGNWWRPLHHLERCLLFLPRGSGSGSRSNDRFLAGSFVDQILGQRIRATNPKGGLSLVIVEGAGVVVPEHPRLPEAEIGDLEVWITVLE